MSNRYKEIRRVLIERTIPCCLEMIVQEISTSEEEAKEANKPKYVHKNHYNVFISYRESADRELAHELYDLLTMKGATVWLDHFNLQPKTEFEAAIVKGIMDSSIFLPLISREAINSSKTFQNFTHLVETSRADQLLTDYRLAMEFKKRGMISNISPVFIGDRDEKMKGFVYKKYNFTPLRDEEGKEITSSNHPIVSVSPLFIRTNDIYKATTHIHSFCICIHQSI